MCMFIKFLYEILVQFQGVEPAAALSLSATARLVYNIEFADAKFCSLNRPRRGREAPRGETEREGLARLSVRSASRTRDG